MSLLSIIYPFIIYKEKIYGLKVNTIGQTIKQLRIFLRKRMRKKIIAEIDLSDFKITEESVDEIYLTLSRCPSPKPVNFI